MHRGGGGGGGIRNASGLVPFPVPQLNEGLVLQQASGGWTLDDGMVLAWVRVRVRA
jgi:hypothetical protein